MNIRLAFNNIFRSGTRSMITLAAIAMGCVAVILAGGFIEDAITGIREQYINSFLGHIQIARRGYFEKGLAQPFDFMISDSDRLTRLLATVPHVRRVAPRLQFFGLMGSGDATLAFMAQGVSPEAESFPAENLPEGRNLDGRDSNQVVLGAGLAKALGANVGSSVTLLASTKTGGINGMDVTVKGISATASKDYDDRSVRLPLKMAQRVLRTDEVQTVTLYLDRTENTDAVAAEIERRLRGETPPLEVRPWHELSGADFVVKLVGFYAGLFRVFRIIIIAVVVLGIFNTMNMAVLERVGEIGTLMAMGTTRANVIGLFLAEGLILGAIGGLIGLAAGDVLARIISEIGIPMSSPGTTIAWVAKIAIVPRIFAGAYAMSLGAALFSSVYPAVKASRLEIAEALRHNV